MYKELEDKKEKLAVVGLGYVGLPIALEFAKYFSVIGFDINTKRVEMMKNGEDPSKELDASEFKNKDIVFTDNTDVLKEAKFYVVAVPTPINEYNTPNLRPLLSASKTVGSVLKKGDYVIFESTVYPGCTEDDCIPVLEKESGLTFKKDFMVGYSPERINPGDKQRKITDIKKIVSGCCATSLEQIALTYEKIITAGIHRAPTLKVAEAAKIIENTQRDVNIALMNELSIIFDKMNINTYDVLEAAGTKWNFLGFYPGLVGGHCIGVDPYYLTHKAEQFGYHAKIINSGRFVNDSMGFYVAKKTVKKMLAVGKALRESKVLIMGITFKENVSDIRNSKIADVIKELQSYQVNVEVVDPYANAQEVEEEYGFSLIDKPGKDYDAVIVAVNHVPYTKFSEDDFKALLTPDGVVVDIKGVYRDKLSDLDYWSL